MQHVSSNSEEQFDFFKQSQLSGPMQQFENSLDDEQQALNKCQLLFSERRFTSVAFFFDEMPEPDMSHLEFHPSHRANEADRQVRQKNLEKIEETISQIEADQQMYYVENLEDAKMSQDNYHKLKIENLEGKQAAHL